MKRYFGSYIDPNQPNMSAHTWPKQPTRKDFPSSSQPVISWKQGRKIYLLLGHRAMISHAFSPKRYSRIKNSSIMKHCSSKITSIRSMKKIYVLRPKLHFFKGKKSAPIKTKTKDWVKEEKALTSLIPLKIRYIVRNIEIKWNCK